MINTIFFRLGIPQILTLSLLFSGLEGCESKRGNPSLEASSSPIGDGEENDPVPDPTPTPVPDPTPTPVPGPTPTPVPGPTPTPVPDPTPTPVPDPTPTPVPDPTPGPIETYHFDSGWKGLLKSTSSAKFDCAVFGSQCEALCSGKSAAAKDFVNAVGTHDFTSCDERTFFPDPKNPWVLLLQSSHNTKISSLSSSFGNIVLAGQAALEISVEVVKAWDYYLAFDGSYTGAKESKEIMQITVNKSAVVTAVDQHQSSAPEQFKSCYIPQKVSLRAGQNTLKFKAPHDSVHLDAYRYFTEAPAGLPACQ